MNPYDQLNEILPDAPEETRQALLAWAGRQAIWARWHEINLFAQAGQAEHLETREQIVSYFVLRCFTLVAEMEQYTQQPEAEGPAPLLWTTDLPGTA